MPPSPAYTSLMGEAASAAAAASGVGSCSPDAVFRPSRLSMRMVFSILVRRAAMRWRGVAAGSCADRKIETVQGADKNQR